MEDAIKQCPFLQIVAKEKGAKFATNLALNPFKPCNGPSTTIPLFPEESIAFNIESVAMTFHGKAGFLPLPRFCTEEASDESTMTCQVDQPAPPVLPLAAISLSGFHNPFPDPRKLFKSKIKRPRNNKKPQNNNNNNNTGSGKNHHQPPASSSSSSASTTTSSSSLSSGGRCPMRDVFGGILISSTRLECPPVIVKMRAAVAALKPVRNIRPRHLSVRSLALVLTSAGFNIPCGVWREHTEKFSPAWFAAVHATIPFIAMLRKAVLMPQWAVLLTIASAVAGQQAGAGLERKRIKGSSGAWLSGHNNSSGEMKENNGSSSNSNSRSCAVEAGAAAFSSPAYASTTSTLIR